MSSTTSMRVTLFIPHFCWSTRDAKRLIRSNESRLHRSDWLRELKTEAFETTRTKYPPISSGQIPEGQGMWWRSAHSKPAIRCDPANAGEQSCLLFQSGCQYIPDLGHSPKEACRFCFCLAGGGFASLGYLIRAILSRRQGKSSNILLSLQAIPLANHCLWGLPHGPESSDDD